MHKKHKTTSHINPVAVLKKGRNMSLSSEIDKANCERVGASTSTSCITRAWIRRERKRAHARKRPECLHGRQNSQEEGQGRNTGRVVIPRAKP